MGACSLEGLPKDPVDEGEVPVTDDGHLDDPTEQVGEEVNVRDVLVRVVEHALAQRFLLWGEDATVLSVFLRHEAVAELLVKVKQSPTRLLERQEEEISVVNAVQE